MTTKGIRLKLDPAAHKAGKIIKVPQFKLTDIPKVMEDKGWLQAKRFMTRWFESRSYELTMDIKTGRKPASAIDKARILDDLPFDWLFSSSARVEPKVKELIKELEDVHENNGRIGRLTNSFLKQLSNGLLVFMKRLDKLGMINRKHECFIIGYRDFSTYSAMKLDEASQFNFITIGSSLWKKATDKLDDVYGALGSFSIKIAATRFSTYIDQGYSCLLISEIGLYVRDTFDFINIGSDDQQLGYWSKEDVRKPGFLDYLRSSDYRDDGDIRYFAVTNNSFNNYRKKYEKGGDFLVFSKVKRYKVSIIVHLNKIDFMEYIDRTK